MYFLGALAEWLKGHPQYLPAVMNYIVPCLSIPKLSPSAASAFSDICDTCRDSLTDELNSLMHVYSSMANSMIEVRFIALFHVVINHSSISSLARYHAKSGRISC